MKNIEINEVSLTFDDVLMIPRKSIVSSRSECTLTTKLCGLPVLPYVSANMSTISGAKMVAGISDLGGVGILHRTFKSYVDFIREIETLALSKRNPTSGAIGFSIGITKDWKKRLTDGLSILSSYKNVIVCVDVAHAHSEDVLSKLRSIIKVPGCNRLIVGNIATCGAFYAINSIIKDYGELAAVKVGIGSGSCCTTRIMTGCGIPTFQSILNIYSNIITKTGLIADGGIRSSGDIAKAIGAGATAVMLGNVLAGSSWTPGEIINSDGVLQKEYRGSASFLDKTNRKEKGQNVEGVSTKVTYKGETSDIISRLSDGLRSSISYQGYNHIDDLRGQAEFTRVTNLGHLDSTPHIL